MAWRALLRRNPGRSMTLVGDLDQRSGHTPAQSWAELLGTAAREHVRTSSLTINYRTPAEVMRAAVRVLRAAGGANAAPARSAREVPDSLRTTEIVTDSTLVDVVAGEYAALGEGRLAVITAPGRVAATREALAVRLADELQAPAGDVLAAPVAVLDAVAAKGLEFDVVILVEPSEVARGGPGDLYVAMTRPTRRLHIVHRGPLPEGLEEE